MENVRTLLLLAIAVVLVLMLMDGGARSGGAAQLVVTDIEQAAELVGTYQSTIESMSPPSGAVVDIIPQPQPQLYGGATDGSDPNAGGEFGSPNSPIVSASEQQVQQAVIVKDTAVITGLMDGVQSQPDLNSDGIVVTTTRKDDQGNTWTGTGRIFASPGSPHTTQECFAAYIPGSESAPNLEGCGLVWEWERR